MNAWKVGIIGVFILFPLLFLSGLSQRREIRQNQLDRAVEKAISQAMRDGLFALKTYSKFTYEGNRIKEVYLAETETREMINRSFAYSFYTDREEERRRLEQCVRLVGFLCFDSMILYDQKKRERLVIPFYEWQDEGSQISFTPLKIGEITETDGIDRLRLEEKLESILKRYAQSEPIHLPEHTGHIFGKDFSEVGVFVLVEGDPLRGGREKQWLNMGKTFLSEKEDLVF